MSRRTLTDEQWGRIESHLPGRAGTRGRSGVDNRLFVDAVLWMAGNAARWRDLPEVFGKWTGVHARFRRWSRAGVWERLFHTLGSAEMQFQFRCYRTPTLSALVDEPIVNQHIPDLATLEQIIAQRCVDLAGQPDQISSQTQFHWWPTIPN